MPQNQLEKARKTGFVVVTLTTIKEHRDRFISESCLLTHFLPILKQLPEGAEGMEAFHFTPASCRNDVSKAIDKLISDGLLNRRRKDDLLFFEEAFDDWSSNLTAELSETEIEAIRKATDAVYEVYRRNMPVLQPALVRA